MEYLISENFNCSKYEGKSILILGGGPSTNEVNWENLEYDYVWSCTNFFMNDRILNQNLDLGTLGNLQNFKDQRLINFLETNPQLKILIETDYLYPNTIPDNRDFFTQYEDRIYYGKCDKSYTTFVGPPARLMLLACNLKAGKIYFAGIDGYDKNMKNPHSFTDVKGLNEEAAYNKYEMWYKAMTTFTNRIWEDFNHRTEFFNLGEVSQCHNIPSFVSKEKFPLPPEVYEKIK